MTQTYASAEALKRRRFFESISVSISNEYAERRAYELINSFLQGADSTRLILNRRNCEMIADYIKREVPSAEAKIRKDRGSPYYVLSLKMGPERRTEAEEQKPVVPKPVPSELLGLLKKKPAKEGTGGDFSSLYGGYRLEVPDLEAKYGLMGINEKLEERFDEITEKYLQLGYKYKLGARGEGKSRYVDCSGLIRLMHSDILGVRARDMPNYESTNMFRSSAAEHVWMGPKKSEPDLSKLENLKTGDVVVKPDTRVYVTDRQTGEKHPKKIEGHTAMVVKNDIATGMILVVEAMRKGIRKTLLSYDEFFKRFKHLVYPKAPEKTKAEKEPVKKQRPKAPVYVLGVIPAEKAPELVEDLSRKEGKQNPLKP